MNKIILELSRWCFGIEEADFFFHRNYRNDGNNLSVITTKKKFLISNKTL